MDKLEMEDDEKALLQSICEKIRDMREERGITLEQSEALGWVNWRTLQRIETHPIDMKILTLFKISKLYNEKMSTILYNIEKELEAEELPMSKEQVIENIIETLVLIGDDAQNLETSPNGKVLLIADLHQLQHLIRLLLT